MCWLILWKVTAIIKSLWPSDAIWQHRSGSTLARVMVCCLMAPNQYLNQCWLIISKVQWHSLQGNLTRDNLVINKIYLVISKISLKSMSLTFHSNIPGANELPFFLLKPLLEDGHFLAWHPMSGSYAEGNQGPLLLTWFNFNPSMDK